MPRGVRARAERLRTQALVVRRSVLGDADLVLSLFTERRGLVSAVARAARRSSKRFAALEPMHLLDVTIDERATSDLGSLVEASIARPRLRLAGHLERLEHAGRALRWVRRATTPHTAEPEIWRELNALLDALDEPEMPVPPIALLAGTGLRLLRLVGWGLDLEGCVRCSRPCAPDAAAYVDAEAGGLVCRACGGGGLVLRAEQRARLAAAAASAEAALDEGHARVALELVDATLAAHAGLR